MDNSISICIIIPSFNSSSTIKLTLDSILNQKLPSKYKLEVIVIDDASSDNSPLIIKEFQSKHQKIQLIKTPQNMGRSGAINYGIKNSSSELIVIIDSDCYWPSRYTLQQALISTNKHNTIIGLTTSTTKGFWGKYLRDVENNRKQSQSALGYTTANLIIRRSTIEQAGLFDESYTHYGFEDKALLAKLIDLPNNEIKIDHNFTAIHETKELNLSSLQKKYFIAGKHTSKNFSKQHPSLYLNTIYSKLDSNINPLTIRAILTLLLSIHNPLSHLTCKALDAIYFPYVIKKILIKTCLAISFFKGSKDRIEQNNKTRVLCVTSTFPAGSNDPIPTFIHDLCKSLQQPYDITVLAPHKSGSTVSTIDQSMRVLRFRYAPSKFEKLAYGSGISDNLKNQPFLIFVVPIFLLSQSIHIAYITHRFRIDICHCHWLHPQGLAFLLAKPLLPKRTKSLLTLHGSDLKLAKLYGLKTLSLKILKSFDKLSAVSEDMVSDITTSFKLSEKVHTTPMGVCTETFNPLPNITKNKISLIFVGRLISTKRPQLTLLILKELLENNLLANLIIVGQGPEEDSLRKKTKELNLTNNVTFMGFVPHKELPGLLNKSQFLLMTSESEGFGLTALEAMACGTIPVVNTACAISTILLQNECGIVCGQPTPQEYTKNIIKLTSAPKLLNATSLKAISTSKAYSWNTNKKNIIAIYEKLTDSCHQTLDQ